MAATSPAMLTLTQSMVDRACGEFIEMPGLRLTRQQAQRLWGLDEPTCTELLDYLVDVNFLARRAGESYGRVADGAVCRPRLRF